MKKLIALFAGVAALSLFAAATADEKSEKGGTVTKTGKIACAKCTLKLEGADSCAHVLVVKEGGKDVNYFVDDDNKDHKKVCPPGTKLDAKVTGKLVEKDGKKTIESAKVEFKK